MKKILLFPMMVCLLLAGCRPDDDVDIPEPQQPVSELILGKWVHVSITSTERDTIGHIVDESTSLFNNVVYDIQEDHIEIYEDPEKQDTYAGTYTLSEGGGKHYIEWGNINFGLSKYEITAISDTKMTWEMNDSLVAISDPFSEYAAERYPNRIHIREEFKREE